MSILQNIKLTLVLTVHALTHEAHGVGQIVIVVLVIGIIVHFIRLPHTFLLALNAMRSKFLRVTVACHATLVVFWVNLRCIGKNLLETLAL